MSGHYPPELRATCLRELQHNGLDYEATSKAHGVARGTLRTWVRRYGLPEPPRDAPAPAEEYVAPAPAPPSTPPTNAGSTGTGIGAGPPPPPPSVERTPLEDLGRADYLADRIRWLERIANEIAGADSPTWSAMRALLALQSEMHLERVEVIRSEGAQLDLEADPTAIARALEAEERLLRSLRVILDMPE